MGLTVKQREFAKLVATGVPQMTAYNQLYGIKGKGKKARDSASRQTQAGELARSPQIQREIESWRQVLKPIVDLRVLKTETLQNLRWLMTESPSQNVRFAAAKVLLEHCEQYSQREQKLLDRGPVDVETLLGELASLREKEPPTIELEASVDDGTPAQGNTTDSEVELSHDESEGE
jgi:hypothetical protein